jgi:hypothetical protein
MGAGAGEINEEKEQSHGGRIRFPRVPGERAEKGSGGPARLLVPHLYFWKSAKWIRGLKLLRQDQPGFWEAGGYHDRGDPWLEVIRTLTRERPEGWSGYTRRIDREMLKAVSWAPGEQPRIFICGPTRRWWSPWRTTSEKWDMLPSGSRPRDSAQPEDPDGN